MCSLQQAYLRQRLEEQRLPFLLALAALSGEGFVENDLQMLLAEMVPVCRATDNGHMNAETAVRCG